MKLPKILAFTVVLTALLTASFTASASIDGPYVAGGYQQGMMFSWQYQGLISNNPGGGSKARMWPGYGAFLLGGWRFKSPDWLAVDIPLGYSRVKTNGAKWDNLYSFGAEVTFHPFFWGKALDLYVGPSFVYNILTVKENFRGHSLIKGPEFGVVFGLEYFVLKRDLSFFFNLPIRFAMFNNDYMITANKLGQLISMPIRLGMAYHF